MAEHEWVRENLDAYVAGALPAEELGRVAQHVATCADCKQALAQAQKLESSLADWFADARPDAKLEERMIRRLRKVRPPRRFAAWARFAIGAAAVVLLGIVGVVVQAIAGGGPFPGIEGMLSPRTQSTNDLKRIHTSIAGGIVGGKAPDVNKETLSVVDVDPAATTFGTDMQYMNERIAEASVHSASLVDDSRSMGEDEKRRRTRLDDVAPVTPSGNARVQDGMPTVSNGSIAGGDKSAPPVNLQSASGEILSYGGKGTSLNGTFFGRSGATREYAARIAGREDTPNAAGQSTSVAEENGANAKAQVNSLAFAKRPAESYFFKPNDGPAMTPPPARSLMFGSGGAGLAAGAGVASLPPSLKTGDKSPRINPVGDLVMPAITQPKTEPQSADAGIKIIRTGDMEFEVDSFDNAVKSIEKLIDTVKGGFKLVGEGKRQDNGKMRGYIVVRMPPQHLNKFVEDVRSILGKTGELKSQRIGSQDVTKQYTDTESELKAARLIEERILAIIKNGKGDVKDLVVAEEKLGIVRTKIEKMEGEIRYYANQVALSTLTITLVEKEIQAAAALVVNETVKMRIEVDNVSKARESAEKAVEEFKGRIVKSDEKQYPAGQVEAIVHAEIPPQQKEAFRRVLEKLGLVSGHEDAQSQSTEGGSFPVITPRRKINDVLFQVTLNNIVNIKPKQSVKLDVVTTDVRTNFEKLKDEIIRVFKGQIRDAKLDENQDKQKAIATIDFSVPIEKKAAMDKLLAGFGPTLDRVNTQAAITEIATEQKFGYQLTLYSIPTVEPREKVRLHVEVKSVESQSAEIADLVKDAKGQMTRPKSGLNRAGQTEALLIISVPLAQSDRLVRDIKDKGKLIDWAQAPNTSVPDNELATAQIAVLLTGPNPIIPNDQGLSEYASKSMYVSFTVLAYSVLFILSGIFFLLPWLVAIWIVVWLVRWLWRKPATARETVAATPEAPKPANP